MNDVAAALAGSAALTTSAVTQPTALPPPKPARRARGAEQRIDQQPGFVLHATAWRETSLILDVFSRDFGRVALVARGAKRPTSQFRGLLTAFNPLSLSWSGRGEVKTLVRVEWLGGLTPLRGDGLLAAFYVNELLVRLLARGDPHESLFSSYIETLGQLAGRERHDRVLRGFELDLLRDIGYALSLDRCADGAAVQPGLCYRIDAERGLVETASVPEGRDAEGWTDENGASGASASGACLLALAARSFDDRTLATEAKQVLRRLIGYHLQGRPLNTRRILRDLSDMSDPVDLD